ncbi:ankyrin repeat domain-containing protein [Legionella sp. km535]|uniref:Dot/Icm T4SS effector AnkQ/LegA10 n=1 Tax=Legionella sp. km535 TaxID=2498107 RepID=UPI000F8D3B20|nr:Dot/Icm T4SS effector AnkQ/LegA10 [Legionella sp. km535]RUR20339.1 ankyrin repeat domain-containing protein [Legionella sp. km535]
MSASASVIKKKILHDKLILIINREFIQLDEIDQIVQEELHYYGSNPDMVSYELDLLTHLGHLVSFIRQRQFTNPLWALHIFLDKNTRPETNKALISAILMTQEKDDKSYEVICRLAQENKLEYYTNISMVPPVRIYRRSEHDEYDEYDEYTEWYFLFELFSLTRIAPPELIPIIADWLIETTPSIMHFSAIINFLNTMRGTLVVHQKIFKELMSCFHSTAQIETLESVFKFLLKHDLLHEKVLQLVISRLEHINSIRTFFTVYHLELQQNHTQLSILEFLPLYCQLTQVSAESYDDKISSNTPLHLSVIERNRANLETSLSLANHKLLIRASYENTALLLACKLGDRAAARLILAKMRELDCDVNQQDSHGMSALHWACFYHFDDLIEELRVAGANDQLKNTDGKDCFFFYHHRFTLRDFKRNGREIIDGEVKLENPGLTDLCFHMEKIALNLNLTTPDELMTLYRSDELAQIRSASRFQLFFLAFRTRLVDWLEKQHGSEAQATLSLTGPS